MVDETKLIAELHKQGVFRFGEFMLKSGELSPIYIDLRVLISSPKILHLTADRMCEKIKDSQIDCDYIVGVPYAALPVSTLICDRLDKPMLLRRKEAKKYGTKKLIEGNYERGKKALVVEDVVTSGESIIDTVTVLRKEGLIVEDVITVLDRQQMGAARIKDAGCKFYSVLTMAKILDYLVTVGTINLDRKTEVVERLAHPIYANKERMVNGDASNGWSIKERLKTTRNAFNKQILNIMAEKKTCLCVAADLTSCEAVLKLARVIAPYICALKLHVDIIDDFSKDFIRKLTEIARNNNFVILEDRKLADTGKTVVDQLTRGVYGICSWADVVTVHALPGSSILSSVKSVMKREDSVLKSCLLVAELSTEHSLTALAGYTDAVVDMANEDLDVVSGFICQERCAKDSRFLYWTPGVNLDAVSDGAGQQWKSIEKAIRDQGNDVIIVGRAITGSPDVEKEVKRYRTAAWDAFIQRNDPSADIA